VLQNRETAADVEERKMKTDQKTIPGSLGTVETQYYTFGEPPNELLLENGERLGPVTLAFETYGELDKNKANAVLILHALTGDAHAAGLHPGDRDPGWWDNMIGPGKAFDTDKYFIICANVIGGCKGSTGPSSTNPSTGKPYSLDFPEITVGDMVKAQCRLIDHLNIERLLCVAGGSMGGMQVIQWMVSYPERIRSAIPIATTLRHSPQQIAFNEVGRQAIMADPNWNGGDYYGGALPANGLAVARMIGHITYMSDTSMAEKFGRRLKNNIDDFKFNADFEVEGYLQYRGSNFVKRFDANSYLYVTKAIDRFDVCGDGRLSQVFESLEARVLVIAFRSDWLYPPYQSEQIVKACKLAGLDVSYCEIDSGYGHDAFLLEAEEETRLVRYFLEKLYRGEVTPEDES
jgi:homoserine O-acetyltransferase